MTNSDGDVFAALAEPNRRRILSVLANGEHDVSQLVQRLGISQPLTSKHLRVLRRADLVHVRQHAQQRLYRLNAPALQPVHQWVGSFEQFWQESFERLDRHLQQIQARKRDDDRHN